MWIPRFAPMLLLVLCSPVALVSASTWVATVTYYTDSSCTTAASSMSGGVQGLHAANAYTLNGGNSNTSACADWNANPAVLYVASSASKTNICVTFFTNAECSGSGDAFHLYDYNTCYQDTRGDLSAIAGYFVKVTLADTSLDYLPADPVTHCEPPVWAVNVAYFSDNTCTAPVSTLPGGISGVNTGNAYSMTAIDSAVSACSRWNIVGSLHVKATAGANDACVVFYLSSQCTTAVAHHLYTYGECYQDTNGDGSLNHGYFVKATLLTNTQGEENLPSIISICSGAAQVASFFLASLVMPVALAVLATSWF